VIEKHDYIPTESEKACIAWIRNCGDDPAAHHSPLLGNKYADQVLEAFIERDHHKRAHLADHSSLMAQAKVLRSLVEEINYLRGGLSSVQSTAQGEQHV